MSEEQDDSQKTEDPTPRKLEEARKKGQVAQSKEITHAVMIFSAFLVIMIAFPFMTRHMTASLGLFIDRAHDIRVTGPGVSALLAATLWDTGLILAGIFLFFMAMAYFSGFLQNGMLFAPENLKPKLERISPVKGFKRLFSMKSIVEFVKGILKLAIVGTVATLLMLPLATELDLLVSVESIDLMDKIYRLCLKLLIGVFSIVLVIAALDWFYQRFEFMKQMRMSRQELKDEFKQTEGDPMIKSKIRQIRQERARQRMMSAVPDASVVITNPTHYAIALEYKEIMMGAPKCVAKGVDNIALKIREVAKEHDVPIVENPPLARALYDAVDLDEEIPEEHFKAVAEIIAYVYKLQGKKINKPKK